MIDTLNLSEADEKRRRDELERAYRAVYATRAGKLVLYDILSKSGIYGASFSGENTHTTNFILGQQEVGKRLIRELDSIDARFYPKLLLDMAEMREMELEAARRAAARKLPEDDNET